MKEVLTLLTAHARVVLCIAAHPEWTVREIAKAVGTSERQLFRWLSELQAAGYLIRVKSGRRTRYVLRADAPLQEGFPGHWTLSDFLALVTRHAAADEDESATGEAHRQRFSIPRLRGEGLNTRHREDE